MNLDNLGGLPEWNDFRSGRGQDGDEWKTRLKRDRARLLYNQWLVVMELLEAFCNTIPTQRDELEQSFVEQVKHQMVGDAMKIGIKIHSAETADLYVARMENASIIREAANFVYISLYHFRDLKGVDDSYLEVIRLEICGFRDLFCDWVASFERDEYEDEWGLYV